MCLPLSQASSAKESPIVVAIVARTVTSHLML